MARTTIGETLKEIMARVDTDDELFTDCERDNRGRLVIDKPITLRKDTKIIGSVVVGRRGDIIANGHRLYITGYIAKRFDD